MGLRIGYGKGRLTEPLDGRQIPPNLEPMPLLDLEKAVGAVQRPHARWSRRKLRLGGVNVGEWEVPAGRRRRGQIGRRIRNPSALAVDLYLPSILLSVPW